MAFFSKKKDEQIEVTDLNLPSHIGIIMDGNGRWAKKRGLPRKAGHRQGAKTFRTITRYCSDIGIKYLTVYAFSTENWKRPEEEVKALMALMIQAVANETPELVKNNIRVKVIGDIGRLPAGTKRALDYCLETTSTSTGTTVILALSYSSKWELTEAIKDIVKDVQSGNIQPDNINEPLVASYLSTNGIPDPDILIRTGGELRVSNFLLWQIAYSELYFTDELWPDFNEESFYRAVLEYQNRERRFGKTSEQVTEES